MSSVLEFFCHLLGWVVCLFCRLLGWVLGLFRRLLGWVLDKARSRSDHPSYNYHSESQSTVQPAQLLSGHNAPTRYESPWTTPTTSISTHLRYSNTQSTSTKPDSSSSSKPRYSSKPTLSQAPFNPILDQQKTNYVRVKKGTTTPIYKVPDDDEALLKKDILPRRFKQPLSPSTYKDFFHTMLYAEDCYLEKWDGKFSFNRICLERAHQAIDTASDHLFKNFLFPTSDSSAKVDMWSSVPHFVDRKLDKKQIDAVSRICSRHGSTPYLIEGPLCIIDAKQLSRTGIVIREAILHTYRTKPDARILICAPTNSTCDELVKSIGKEVPESAMFRANAACRKRDEVPLDILPFFRISGDCFSCPLLKELEKFKVVSSTYMSCFRLHNEGLVAGHFSKIFMLDASSATEPEALVVLANFVHESTDVVVTGTRGNSSRWVRSPVARGYGLMKSYFERIYESKLYKDFDPKYVSQL